MKMLLMRRAVPVLALLFSLSTMLTAPNSTFANRRLAANMSPSCSTIAEKYVALGGKAVLGQTIQSERPTPDRIGRYAEYELGHIHWSPETCAHFTRGAIRDKWREFGWET